MMRRIHPGDSACIEQICRLEQASFGEGGLNRWHLMPLVRHGRVYGYYKAGLLIGCAQFILDWDNKEKAYLYGFSMAGEYRGRGLGTKFLESSLAELAREGIKKVELTVAPDNQAARKVYEEKLGFQIVGSRCNEYGPGETRLVLERDLTSPRG